jgi:hypothetical protein
VGTGAGTGVLTELDTDTEVTLYDGVGVGEADAPPLELTAMVIATSAEAANAPKRLVVLPCMRFSLSASLAIGVPLA